MAHYCVNKNAQNTGEHEVHKVGCVHYPDQANRVSLGEHNSCHTAVTAARKHYDNVDGCFYCSIDCHTR